MSTIVWIYIVLSMVEIGDAKHLYSFSGGGVRAAVGTWAILNSHPFENDGVMVGLSGGAWGLFSGKQSSDIHSLIKHKYTTLKETKSQFCNFARLQTHKLWKETIVDNFGFNINSGNSDAIIQLDTCELVGKLNNHLDLCWLRRDLLICMDRLSNKKIIYKMNDIKISGTDSNFLDFISFTSEAWSETSRDTFARGIPFSMSSEVITGLKQGKYFCDSGAYCNIPFTFDDIPTKFTAFDFSDNEGEDQYYAVENCFRLWTRDFHMKVDKIIKAGGVVDFESVVNNIKFEGRIYVMKSYFEDNITPKFSTLVTPWHGIPHPRSLNSEELRTLFSEISLGHILQLNDNKRK